MCLSLHDKSVMARHLVPLCCAPCPPGGYLFLAVCLQTCISAFSQICLSTHKKWRSSELKLIRLLYTATIMHLHRVLYFVDLFNDCRMSLYIHKYEMFMHQGISIRQSLLDIFNMVHVVTKWSRQSYILWSVWEIQWDWMVYQWIHIHKHKEISDNPYLCMPYGVFTFPMGFIRIWLILFFKARQRSLHRAFPSCSSIQFNLTYTAPNHNKESPQGSLYCKPKPLQ